MTCKNRPEMTFNVFGGTLNLAQSVSQTELLQMLEVATVGSHSHVDSQGLMKFATALLMCSCGSSSQMACKATFTSSVVFGWSS